MEQSFFAGKAYLKINSLVKMPLHEFMAVERSGLLAPAYIYLLYCLALIYCSVDHQILSVQTVELNGLIMD